MVSTERGITAPQGFTATGTSCGIKKSGLDLALIVSETPAIVGGTLTTNVVHAAPIRWNRAILGTKQPVRAVVVNSGNANACTGEQGERDTQATAEAAANALQCQPADVLVGSTGIIGVPLPIEKLIPGVERAATQLSAGPETDIQSADAICTTDTFRKQASLTVEIGGKTVTLGGMSKGAGMIHPNMATMLGFITTDCAISQALLQLAVSECVADSFNQITVDGDTSTNDMVLVLANGLAQNPTIETDGPEFEAFKSTLYELCLYLAHQIVRDGEGATKFVEASVSGAKTIDDARILSRIVLNSNLVKTALFGSDANWGRVLAAMGRSGVSFNPATVSVSFESAQGSIFVLDNGKPIAFDEEKAKTILLEKDLRINIRMQEGSASAKAWGCDLTYEYVRINGDYRS